MELQDMIKRTRKMVKQNPPIYVAGDSLDDFMYRNYTEFWDYELNYKCFDLMFDIREQYYETLEKLCPIRRII